MVDFWDIVRSNPDTFLVVPDVVTSHDTGEDRPLVEVCDECEFCPDDCGREPSECECEGAAENWEAERDAYD